MSVGEQLLAGLELTATGMVTVFVLLSLMVLVIGWMSKLALRLQPPEDPHAISGPPSGGPDAMLVSAISAAVHRYRREHRRQD
jgi:oxaloacetate decarboxylase gamma subunit